MNLSNEESMVETNPLNNEYTTDDDSSNTKGYTPLPISRVNAIMRSCPLTTVKNDAIALTSFAAELFVRDTVRTTYHHSPNKSELTYDILANTISYFTFLKDAVPPKMTVEEYNNLVRDTLDDDD